jgi:hypothetical protein
MADGSEVSDDMFDDEDEEEDEDEVEEEEEEDEDGDSLSGFSDDALDGDSSSLLGEELCWAREPPASQSEREWTTGPFSDDPRRARWLHMKQFWEVQTHVSHNQCSDALASLGGSQLCLVKRRVVSLFDTERGVSVCDSPSLPFDIYGLAADVTSGWVAAGGAQRTSSHHNVALLRLVHEGDSTSWVVSHTFTCGEIDPATGSDQVNSVRFAAVSQPAAGGEGVAAMRTVLIVGSQDAHVYIYPLPPVPAVGASSADARPPRPLRVHTFPVAINCACASPDGRLLAAAGDREEVYLCGGDAGFVDDDGTARHQTLHIMDDDPTPEFEPAGCQYLAWSADSRLLAASSDTVDGIAVWAVHPDYSTRPPEPLARVLHHDSHVLALSFVGASHVLAWAEQLNVVHVADVDHLAALGAGRSCWKYPLYRNCTLTYLRTLGMQRLYLVPPKAPSASLMWQPSGEPGRITGLCACGPADILVALPHAIFRLQAITEWSRELHPQFPASFHVAVRTLLLCANQQPPLPGQGAAAPPTLSSLPPEILLRIIAFAAVPPSSWLRSTRASAEEELELLENNGSLMTFLDEDEDDDDEMDEEGDEEMLGGEIPED